MKFAIPNFPPPLRQYFPANPFSLKSILILIEVQYVMTLQINMLQIGLLQKIKLFQINALIQVEVLIQIEIFQIDVFQIYMMILIAEFLLETKKEISTQFCCIPIIKEFQFWAIKEA